MKKEKKVYEADKKLAIAEEELGYLNKDRLFTQKNYAILKEKLETLHEESSKALKEIEIAKRDFKRALQDLEIAQERSENGLKELTKVQSNSEMVKRELAQLEEHLSRINKEIDSLHKNKAEISLLKNEECDIGCCIAVLDNQLAQNKMELQSMLEKFNRLSSELKDSRSAGLTILPDQQTVLNIQITKVQMKIAKVENILANLNMQGADYERRRQNLETELHSLQGELSTRQEELNNIPQMDLTDQTEQKRRRDTKVEVIRDQLAIELFRIKESVWHLETESAHMEKKRDVMEERLHRLKERNTELSPRVLAGLRVNL